MLDNLYALYPDVSFDQLEVVEYVHAGLFCQVLRVDRPTQDSSWLLNCVKRNHNDSPTPQTSTSP